MMDKDFAHYGATKVDRIDDIMGAVCLVGAIVFMVMICGMFSWWSI